MDSSKSKIVIEGETLLSVASIKLILGDICIKYSLSVRRLLYQNVSRESIVEINTKHLNHNYETDIITFNYSKNGSVNAEIYVCPDVIESNSLALSEPLKKEKMRVYIHGLLHIVGFDDHSDADRQKMREEEDFWLNQE